MRKLTMTKWAPAKLVPTKLILAMALFVLVAGSAAIAQTGGAGNSGVSSSSAGKRMQPLPAPVGHRQPRIDELPSENELSNPNSPTNREDAALDRKIKSICRGC
ncbi:MAG: hypothetical protein QOF22_368 [Bradyrhizobium sp.]|jgi:hypothetical protein|nr:hypothetical protein [Bradyrhizobium sp.]